MQGSSQSQLFVGFSTVHAIPLSFRKLQNSHVHIQAICMLNPCPIFCAHAGHAVWECIFSERLWPVPSFGQLYLSCPRTCSTGGSHMHPNHIAFFSDQRLYGFCQVVQQVCTCRKLIGKLPCMSVKADGSQKRAIVDLYTIQ